MPSFVTHHHFSVLVQQAAAPELAHACQAAPAAYAWGAQGPDPLFFYHAPFGGKAAKAGSELHRKQIGEAFRAMTAKAVSLKDPAALAYLLGFATHYALDETTHPYIEDTTRLLMRRYGADNSAAHKLCETDLDAAIILNYISGEPASYPAYKQLDCDHSDCGAVSKVLAAAARTVVPSVTAEQAESSLHTMREVYRLFHAGEPTRRLLTFFETIARKKGAFSNMVRGNNLLPEDCLNERARDWTDWEKRSHQTGFTDLMEGDALQRALALQAALYDAYHKNAPLSDLFFTLDYSGRRLQAAQKL